MYLCEMCQTLFDEPLTRIIRMTDDGRSRMDVETLCPVCASPYFKAADSCPACHGYKRREDNLCAACRKDLLGRFTAFVDALSEAEEAQLDDWLDGDSITNRRNWR